VLDKSDRSLIAGVGLLIGFMVSISFERPVRELPYLMAGASPVSRESRQGAAPVARRHGSSGYFAGAAVAPPPTSIAVQGQHEVLGDQHDQCVGALGPSVNT